MTNGKTSFLAADGRSREARRWHDVYAGLLGQLETLGPVHAYQQDLCADAATLRLVVELARAKVARAEPVDMDELTRAVNTLQRLLRALGLDLKPERPRQHSRLAEMVRK